jgi:hypothetical protein
MNVLLLREKKIAMARNGIQSLLLDMRTLNPSIISELRFYNYRFGL